MAISMALARKLCTQREVELVEASRPGNLKELTPGRLKQKITRARALRDKYRDLAKRQRLEARGKRQPQRARPAQNNENTRRKAELFGEVLDRFEARVEKLESMDTKASARVSAGGKRGDAKRPAKKGLLATEMKAPRTAGAAAPKGARRRTAGQGGADKRNQAVDRKRGAHARSAGRRAQSRRDRR